MINHNTSHPRLKERIWHNKCINSHVTILSRVIQLSPLFVENRLENHQFFAKVSQISTNMRKSTLTFILLIAAVLCFAQKSSLKKYYYWINQAELAICDSDFQRASDCYDKAFDQHRPFNGHVYYAFKVNTQFVHNNERALRYFHILCQSGDDIEWYREDSVIYASIWPQMKNDCRHHKNNGDTSAGGCFGKHSDFRSERASSNV